MHERDVFRRDLDEARAVLHEATGEQAALAEAAGVVFRVALLRLQREVEGRAFLRAEEPVRVVQRTQHGLLLEVAHELAVRVLVHELAIEAVAIVEAVALW